MTNKERENYIIEMMMADEESGTYQKLYNLTEKELRDFLFDCWLVSKNLCEGSPDTSFFTYFDKVLNTIKNET